MSIESLLIAVLGTGAAIAIAVAWLATVRARKVEARLRALELEYRRADDHQPRPSAGDVTLAASSPTSAASDPPRASEESTTKTPVLIVEDEPGIREFITHALRRRGREVVAVVGPLAALTALSNRRDIPLMLIDIVMPQMDGYDLAIEARKIAPNIRIVFMSAFAPDPLRHPGGDGFLSKPFTAEALITIVDKALAF